MITKTAAIKAVHCIVLLGIFHTFSVQAHHAEFGTYDVEKMITIEGEITEVWFQNPHSRYYVNVENENGEVELWETGTMSPNWFLRRDWDEDTVTTGMKVSISGHPAWDGSNRLALRIIVRDGVEIYSWLRPASPEIKDLDK
jgi:hypothetical protein